jgi:hypothetical protein
MFIPVIKVRKILDALLKSIKDDYNAHLILATEEESFLYRILHGNSLSDFDFYEQGVDIFIKTDASSRQIQTRMGFDLSTSTLPTIYIHHPSETMKGVNTIGFGFDTNEFYENSDGSYVDKLFRGFGGVFEYVITSPNVLETVLVYEVLHAALLSAVDTFNEDFVLSVSTGKEMVAKSDMMPEPLFLKTIQVDTTYIKEFPRLSNVTEALLVEFNPAIVYDADAIGNDLI